MTETSFPSRDAHRWLAIEFNNRAWDLLEKQDRPPADDLLLLSTAYASLRHWLEAGGPLEEQRAHHLLARVGAEVGEAGLAERHAERCAQLSEENPGLQTPFDRACVAEALARACACAGRPDDARRLRDEALAKAAALEPEDRGVFEPMLRSGRWYGA